MVASYSVFGRFGLAVQKGSSTGNSLSKTRVRTLLCAEKDCGVVTHRHVDMYDSIDFAVAKAAFQKYGFVAYDMKIVF